jgi:hypothetical protein
VLAVPVLISAQTGPGPCHPYPGAAAKDVLDLIGNSLNSEDLVECDATTRRATISRGNGVITTACPQSMTSVSKDAMVRRALTTVGSCALNDYGSISGYYIADDGSKTCYLYPGQESHCTL